MTAPFTLSYVTYDLEQLVEHAPVLRLRSNDSTDVHEPQVLVGHVMAPESARVQLEGYAVFMDLAHYDRRQKRWNRCLFSEASAKTLAELGAEDQFPFSFEAVPSAGHIATLEAQAEGHPTPELPLREWVQAASLEALARAVEQGWVPSTRVKRSSQAVRKWRIRVMSLIQERW